MCLTATPTSFIRTHTIDEVWGGLTGVGLIGRDCYKVCARGNRVEFTKCGGEVRTVVVGKNGASCNCPQWRIRKQPCRHVKFYADHGLEMSEPHPLDRASQCGEDVGGFYWDE